MEETWQEYKDKQGWYSLLDECPEFTWNVLLTTYNPVG